jgi:hypothetical protein
MNNIRGAAAIVSFGILFLPFFATAKDNGTQVFTPKKGIAAASVGPANIAAAHGSWYYNWRSTPNSGTVPAGVQAPEYVPMIGRSGDVTDANINRLKTAQANGTYKYLLGFNEPDQAGQANMTVAQVIAAWPRLMETGLILGSPAPSWTGTWIDNFMTQAAANNLRVDFVCLHFYRSPAATGVVNELKTFLTNAYNKYHKPIWLTEFGAPDCAKLGWCGSAPALTQAVTDTYVNQVIAMLEDLSFVQRYAWFVDKSQSGFEFSAVFNNDGSLTQTGIDLRDAHGTALVKSYEPSLGKNAGGPCVRVRPDGRIVCSLPGRQTAYRFGIFSAAGRLVASYSGSGSGEVALGGAAGNLTRGTYFARLEYGGVARQARVVVE